MTSPQWLKHLRSAIVAINDMQDGAVTSLQPGEALRACLPTVQRAGQALSRASPRHRLAHLLGLRDEAVAPGPPPADALPRPAAHTATLLLRAGVPLQHVQRILRHRDVKLTADTYGNLEVEDLRTAVDPLPEDPIIDAEFTVHRLKVGPASHGFAPLRTNSAARPLPPGEPRKDEGRRPEDFSKDSAPF